MAQSHSQPPPPPPPPKNPASNPVSHRVHPVPYPDLGVLDVGGGSAGEGFGGAVGGAPSQIVPFLSKKAEGAGGHLRPHNGVQGFVLMLRATFKLPNVVHVEGEGRVHKERGTTKSRVESAPPRI